MGFRFRDAANSSLASHVHSYARRDLRYRRFPIEALGTPPDLDRFSVKTTGIRVSLGSGFGC